MNFIVNNTFNFKLILEKKDDEIQAEESCDYTDEDDSDIHSYTLSQLKEREKKCHKKICSHSQKSAEH